MNNKIHPNQSTSCHRAVGSAIYCPQVRCPARTEGTRRQAGTFLLPGKGAQAPRARAERRPPPQRRVLAHGHFGQTTGTSWLGSGSRSCSKPPPRDLGAPQRCQSVRAALPPARSGPRWTARAAEGGGRPRPEGAARGSAWGEGRRRDTPWLPRPGGRGGARVAPPGWGAAGAGRYRTAWSRHSPARTSAASAPPPLLFSAAGAA